MAPRSKFSSIEKRVLLVEVIDSVFCMYFFSPEQAVLFHAVLPIPAKFTLKQSLTVSLHTYALHTGNLLFYDRATTQQKKASFHNNIFPLYNVCASAHP